MCPAQVYEAGAADGDGMVHVEVNPSNCVQCGAISAKGGRLTPPEGGSGPEYTAYLDAGFPGLGHRDPLLDGGVAVEEQVRTTSAGRGR